MKSHFCNSKEELYRNLIVAKKDWKLALQHFEYAVEQEAIDIAIYKLKETESRYMYLLQLVKEVEKEEKLQGKKDIVWFLSSYNDVRR